MSETREGVRVVLWTCPKHGPLEDRTVPNGWLESIGAVCPIKEEDGADCFEALDPVRYVSEQELEAVQRVADDYSEAAQRAWKERADLLTDLAEQLEARAEEAQRWVDSFDNDAPSRLGAMGERDAFREAAQLLRSLTEGDT